MISQILCEFLFSKFITQLALCLCLNTFYVLKEQYTQKFNFAKEDILKIVSGFSSSNIETQLLQFLKNKYILTVLPLLYLHLQIKKGYFIQLHLYLLFIICLTSLSGEGKVEPAYFIIPAVLCSLEAEASKSDRLGAHSVRKQILFSLALLFLSIWSQAETLIGPKGHCCS